MPINPVRTPPIFPGFQPQHNRPVQGPGDMGGLYGSILHGNQGPAFLGPPQQAPGNEPLQQGTGGPFMIPPQIPNGPGGPNVFFPLNPGAGDPNQPQPPFSGHSPQRQPFDRPGMFPPLGVQPQRRERMPVMPLR